MAAGIRAADFVPTVVPSLKGAGGLASPCRTALWVFLKSHTVFDPIYCLGERESAPAVSVFLAFSHG